MEIKLLQDIRDLLTPRNPLGNNFQVSSTQFYTLDYKNRKYVYLFTATGIALSFEEMGNITTNNASWTNISFKAGMRVFAPNNATPVFIHILCTDNPIDTSSSSGGGGGGAVTIADGADTAEGAKADAAVTNPATSGSVISFLKGIVTLLAGTLGISGTVSVSNFPATQPVSGSVTANAGTNLNTSLLALETGGNLATLAGAVSSSKVQTQQQVASSGGAIPYHNLTAASTNFTNVKNAATQCYGVDVSNTSASVIFVKLYDKATTPTTGDTPKRTIQVPANSTVCRAYPEGLKFTLGFGWAATGAVADNDNTNIAASCVVDYNLAT